MRALIGVCAIMVVISVACPVPGCDWIVEHEHGAVVAALLTTHGNTAHVAGRAAHAGHGPKAEKLKRPTVSLAGTSRRGPTSRHGGASTVTVPG